MTPAARTPEMEERLMRWRRRAMLWSSAVMPPYFVEDLLTGGANTSRLIAIKVVWGLVLLGSGLLLPRASPRARRGMLIFNAFISAAGMSGIAFLRGDHNTPYFAWLMALPFCLVVLIQDDVAAAVIGSVTTLLGAAAILGFSAASGADQMQWLMCISTSCGLAIYASIHQRARVRVDYGHNLARLEALEKLAQSEKLRAQSERMALVGQLAAGVAHEINNPLAFVISNLAFLEGEFTCPSPNADERVAVLAETQLGLTRIKSIVRDLTAFSRVSEEPTTEVDLLAIVAEAERLASARTQGRIGVMNELPADLKRVFGNQRHLSQVFLNLILNAADALAARADGKIWIRATSAADGVRIEVDDNGPGLTDAVQASLFQPFFTTKAPGKGTGLGLATSREYVRRAGGDLAGGPRPGGGARFTLALRCAPAP